MENWAEIRRLHRAEGVPIKAIARRLGISRNAVRRALASQGPPRYQRPAVPVAFDAVEPQVRVLLREFPDVPATVLAERVGWTRSSSVFRSHVAELRPLFRPVDPASRTTYQPGVRVRPDVMVGVRPDVSVSGGCHDAMSAPGMRFIRLRRR